ncbi:hypothetical protein [Rhodococcus pyridinivorans]|uniref:Uncharacterized protein n=1 Tax=Rhodococcus pyridinivorans AK37 TaxID=1114960 RepID=H0JL66_9NOCA|nr:hypothetical protein [Rhodococcus pyridinivorans]EHK86401.1 hypothetical protein AK37_01597 [Rhodococcus pyridinivorans AK37]MCD2139508.1 hypothetical protein [Rhodococcus pyridinivorans]
MTLTRNDVIDLLSAASSVDLRKVGEADVTGWGAMLRQDLDRDLAFEALRQHYATSSERIMPAHINTIAVSIRRDRAERERAAEVSAAARALPDAQLAGLPIGGADGNPVWAAYEVNDAISRECPTCKQPPECACVNPINDSARKIPCHARTRIPKGAA